METPPQTRLTFRFEGGDADGGQLNFYDAARFQYGAARFVYTLEYFRQTGIVLSKITRRVNAEYRVPTPERGSWVMDVVQFAAPLMGEMAFKVPIEVMMAHVMEQLIPGRKSRETLKEILSEPRSPDSERTILERERTAQERERTEQIRLLTNTNAKALDVLGKTLDRLSAGGPATQTLHEVRDELTASFERVQMIEHYKRELDKIDDSYMTRLLDKTRTQVVEMGKPLIRSADRLAIGEVSRPQPFVSLTRRSVEALSGNTVDAIPSTLRGSIIRFDKENGWGKFRNPEFTRPISLVAHQ